MNMLNLGLDK